MKEWVMELWYFEDCEYAQLNLDLERRKVEPLTLFECLDYWAKIYQWVEDSSEYRIRNVKTQEVILCCALC